MSDQALETMKVLVVDAISAMLQTHLIELETKLRENYSKEGSILRDQMMQMEDRLKIEIMHSTRREPRSQHSHHHGEQDIYPPDPLPAHRPIVLSIVAQPTPTPCEPEPSETVGVPSRLHSWTNGRRAAVLALHSGPDPGPDLSPDPGPDPCPDPGERSNPCSDPAGRPPTPPSSRACTATPEADADTLQNHDPARPPSVPEDDAPAAAPPTADLVLQRSASPEGDSVDAESVAYNERALEIWGVALSPVLPNGGPPGQDVRLPARPGCATPPPPHDDGDRSDSESATPPAAPEVEGCDVPSSPLPTVMTPQRNGSARRPPKSPGSFSRRSGDGKRPSFRCRPPPPVAATRPRPAKLARSMASVLDPPRPL